METPRVAIVGRPNVGKSTLFNRLLRRRKALVHGEPGITRDRNYAAVTWRGRTFEIVDTGGFDPAARDPLGTQVMRQVRQALSEAALLLFVVDARDGLTPLDESIGKILREGMTREGSRPILLVVNKVDRPDDAMATAEFFELGFEDVFPVSAEHGLGTAELLDAILSHLTFPERSESTADPVTVAIVGKPNVGKSSLLNRLLGEERVIVSDIPGTTRDPVDTLLTREGRRYRLVDTAGIRRRERSFDQVSVLRALRALERSDVALLVLEGVSPLTAQDKTIARKAVEAGCGLILLVNKWDLAPPPTEEHFTLDLRRGLQYCDFAPVLYVSAQTGLRISAILPLVDIVAEERERRIPTADLNSAVQRVVTHTPPPSGPGGPVKVRYVTQVRTRPPTFVCFVSGGSPPPLSYRQYLLHQIRKAYGFPGTPLRLVVRTGRRP